MNSSIISVSEILNNAENIIAAGFAAEYNFDEINAAEYFDELVENSYAPSPIFSGILIMEKDADNFTIIDGLQRIITISLLLCALCENYKNTSKKNEEAKNKILSRYLLSENGLKLKLQGEEKDIYKKILFSQTLDEIEIKSNLARTYFSFLSKMKEHRISGTQLFRIISKIQFMLVITDKSEISIRELYQTINSNKSQINLVSDFIFQKNESTTVKWQKVINSYKSLGYQELLEEFIKDFLTIQNDGKIPNKNAIYNNFKSYFSKISKFQTLEQIIENLCQYAQYYLNIINADFNDDEIREQIIMLNENGGQDSYPYLMEVIDDLQNGHINKDVFSDILIMINSFIKNRQENTLSDVTIDFTSLSKELNKMLVLKDYKPKIIDENKLTINKINNLSTFEV